MLAACSEEIQSAQTLTELNYQNYLYGGKELDRKFGINAYDFTGRYYDLTDNRFWSMDPMAEKYYSISPYAYCLNNPLKNVDPNGLDVWEINVQGELTNRIEDKTQDAFYMVTKNADGNYKRAQTTDDDGNTIDVGISFEYGTVTAVRTPTVNVKNSDGSTTPTKLTTFEMKGDKKATQLFEFMANPGIGTNVEWSHAKIGIERNERNIVGTSQERSSTAVGAYLRATGYSLRDVSHNHPSGIGRPSGVINTDGTRTGDLRGAELYKEKNKNTILNIYIYPSQYFEYNQNGLIIH